jgi:hypothetical protein
MPLVVSGYIKTPFPITHDHKPHLLFCSITGHFTTHDDTRHFRPETIETKNEVYYHFTPKNPCMWQCSRAPRFTRETSETFLFFVDRAPSADCCTSTVYPRERSLHTFPLTKLEAITLEIFGLLSSILINKSSCPRCCHAVTIVPTESPTCSSRTGRPINSLSSTIRFMSDPVKNIPSYVEFSPSGLAVPHTYMTQQLYQLSPYI